MNEWGRRVAAVNATRARFEGRPFAYGTVDCARVAAWHLRQMGHKPVGFAKAGTYRSALGAKKALQRLGHVSLADAVAALGLEERSPAGAWVGDLLIKPGTQGLDAIGIVTGSALVLGFHEDAEAIDMMRMLDFADARAFHL